MLSWLDSLWGLFLIVVFDSTLLPSSGINEAYEEGGTMPLVRTVCSGVRYARVSSDVQKKERTIESQITEPKSQIKESEERLVALHTAAEGLGAPERSAPRDVSARQRCDRAE
jgi:hypothetical protein